MPNLDAINYLIVYPDGPMALWRDIFKDGTVTVTLYDWGMPAETFDGTFREMIDAISVANNRLYVWEDWS